MAFVRTTNVKCDTCGGSGKSNRKEKVPAHELPHGIVEAYRYAACHACYGHGEIITETEESRRYSESNA